MKLSLKIMQFLAESIVMARKGNTSILKSLDGDVIIIGKDEYNRRVKKEFVIHPSNGLRPDLLIVDDVSAGSFDFSPGLDSVINKKT